MEMAHKTSNEVVVFPRVPLHYSGCSTIVKAAEAEQLAKDSDLTPLMSAVIAGQANTVQLLIRIGGSINAWSRHHGSALMLAVAHKRKDVIDMLLEAKADPNLGQQCGLTALALAIEKKDREIVDALIKAGADINAPVLGKTPLMLAAALGYGDMVAVLLRSGANVDVTTDRGDTAVMLAVANGHMGLVDMLVNAAAGALPAMSSERAADAETTDITPVAAAVSEASSALNTAVADGILAAMEDAAVLASAAPVMNSVADSVTSEPKHPEEDVSFWSDDDIIFVDAETSCDEDATSSDDEVLPAQLEAVSEVSSETTAVAAAAEVDGAETAAPAVEVSGVPAAAVKEAVRARRLAMAKTKRRNDALLSAAYTGDVSALEALVQAKVDVNARDRQRRNALMLAIEAGHTAVWQRVLQEPSLDLFATDENVKCALMYAVSRDDVAAVRALVALYRQQHMLATRINKAFVLAHTTGDAQVLQLLLDAGADADTLNAKKETVLVRAVRDGHLSAVLALLRAGADANAVDAQGLSVLLVAISRGDVAIVEALLADGAIVCDSALFTAVRSGDAKMVAVLLAAGADANAQEKKGVSALLHAVRDGNHAVADVLLAAGAAVDARDASGDFALACAVKQCDVHMVERLLAAGADVNAVTADDTSVLQCAVREKQLDIAETLLAAGAKVQAGVPLHYDTEKGCYVRARAGDVETAVALHDLEMLELLVHYADAEEVAEMAKAQVLFAAQSGDSEMLQYLLRVSRGSLTEEDKRNLHDATKKDGNVHVLSIIVGECGASAGDLDLLREEAYAANPRAARLIVDALRPLDWSTFCALSLMADEYQQYPERAEVVAVLSKYK